MLEDVAVEDNARAIKRKLKSLRSDIMSETASLDSTAQAWVEEQLPEVYLSAASETASGLNVQGFQMRALDEQVVNEYSKDLLAGLVLATSTASLASIRLYSAVGSERFHRLLTGRSAVASKNLRSALSRNALGVVYSNGARHALGEYTDMAIRTIIALVRNAAIVNAASKEGIRYFEISDGMSCGWTSHTDPDKANGKIVTEAEARSYPIGHPRCIRRPHPRPDIVGEKQAKEAIRLFDKEIQDLEQALATGNFAAHLNAFSKRLNAFSAKIRT